MNEILLVLIITGIACNTIGVFLVLRNLSMISDAISHSVLLGIVLAYFITSDLNSPLLFIGAISFGILTVLSTETLIKISDIDEDSAIGVIFPIFFSLGVILLSRYARNVHLCVDTVLMGEVIMTPFNRAFLFGFNVPLAFKSMFYILLINISFVLLFFKELKLSSFDREFAVVSGFSLIFLHYSLMSLVSITSVMAFDTVGTILVISFLVCPAATALLITKDLKITYVVSSLISVLNVVLGFILAYNINVNIAGMIATVSGINYILVFLFRPQGFITQKFKLRRQREQFFLELLIVHLGNHKGTAEEKEELGIATISNHLKWDEKRLKKVIKNLIKEEFVYIDNDEHMYLLTEKGDTKFLNIKKFYNF